ncbi:hypothetical protein PHMEG_00018745 [Phytophthora megakarya]|uniref:SWIM-type domain-containing protein n=1 Tax=Phytophthora megakarya TaxID=4795 RepID=A0A225VUL2_9STRA|nr:hypothetical protein PHMEG_00018745 [Phytophthora megakarya]
MGELLQELGACCRQHGTNIRPFAVSPTASKELLIRVKALRNQQLRQYIVPRMSVDFLLLASNTDIFSTGTSLQTERTNPPPIRYREVYSARMEHDWWPVDPVSLACSCAYHFKYAVCVHQLIAIQERARVDLNVAEVLFNRHGTMCKRAADGPAPTAA